MIKIRCVDNKNKKIDLSMHKNRFESQFLAIEIDNASIYSQTLKFI